MTNDVFESETKFPNKVVTSSQVRKRDELRIAAVPCHARLSQNNHAFTSTHFTEAARDHLSVVVAADEENSDGALLLLPTCYVVITFRPRGDLCQEAK